MKYQSWANVRWAKVRLVPDLIVSLFTTRRKKNLGLQHIVKPRTNFLADNFVREVVKIIREGVKTVREGVKTVREGVKNIRENIPTWPNVLYAKDFPPLQRACNDSDLFKVLLFKWM